MNDEKKPAVTERPLDEIVGLTENLLKSQLIGGSTSNNIGILVGRLSVGR